jgi:ADP-ribosyl-[dinitrogen reductase] hydrolase
MELCDRLAGGIWGHLIGDALGVPYEFRAATEIDHPRWGEAGTHGQPPGTWSDDGGLMLALLDSLLTADFDPSDQARRALDWRDTDAYKPGKLFDIGATTAAALRLAAQGVAPERCGGNRESDNGNGALMRILPLALVERATSSDNLVEHAMRASALTHRHVRSQITCALYSLLVRELLRGAERGSALAAAEGTLRAQLDRARSPELELVLSYPHRRGSGYVVDTFWSAWEAFSLASDFAETVWRAIRCGNDTDTTACVAGGLAGVHWGLDAIPAEWVAGMRGRAIVTPLVDRLCLTAAADPRG